MADGNRSDLYKAAAIETFGLNVDCCLKLREQTVESLAQQLNINQRILIGYKLGEGTLPNERISAIAAALAVDTALLTTDHGNDEARKDTIELALMEAGLLSESEQDEDPPDPEPTQFQDDTPTTVEPPGSHMSELDPVWADDLTVSLGTERFNLKTQGMRALIMGHIRAAKGPLSYKELNMRAGLEKPSGWWSSVEKGKSLIHPKDLEQIAAALQVSVGVLLTGHGLDPTMMQSPRNRTSTALVTIKRTIELPAMSAESREAFFRDRVLNKNTEPAEGVAIGQLLELARNQDGVDWEDAWLRLTKRGAAISGLVEEWDNQLGKLAEPIQTLIIEQLARRFSNKDE